VIALSVANPFKRHRKWQKVFLVFGIVQLQSDHRRHVLICRRVRRRYSTTRRQWFWNEPARRLVDHSSSSRP
jgi:hypothetical protein